MTDPNTLADFIEGKAKQYLARAYDGSPATDNLRYRHYSQALFMVANEIRAEMHLEDEASA